MLKKFNRVSQSLIVAVSVVLGVIVSEVVSATPPRTPDQTEKCDLLIVGGGLAGSAAAYEALLKGKTVCLTEMTDWLGGQISSQGTSALDERTTQREKLFFPRGYLEFRDRIKQYYGKLNPGNCWVSYSCFRPDDGAKILLTQLQNAAKKGKGKLKLFLSTVIKDLEMSSDGTQILKAIAIQHTPSPNTSPLNTNRLSEVIEDWYSYENSNRFNKTIIEFSSNNPDNQKPNWYVIEATETGEIIALADVPYRLGVDPRTHVEPSSSSIAGFPYCTQGFTYTFAMEKTSEPLTHNPPTFYQQYEPYFSYELDRLADFDLVFTYRRIWSPKPGPRKTFRGIGFSIPQPQEISMQNWTYGNDYRPGTSIDNFIYTRTQLEQMGQLKPGGWMGGLRTDALRKGEENAIAYFYWLVIGTTDSQLGSNVKKPNPSNRLLTGLNSPMGTEHGLSKYPYIREARRIIGRPSFGHPRGFSIWELDMSRNNFRQDYYKQVLSEAETRRLWAEQSGMNAIRVLIGEKPVDQVEPRGRSFIYSDTVGIGHYAIDFHPCLTDYPFEKPGNPERAGERQGQGQAYPFQIPLRAMIPQKIDNLLVTGKSIATSHVAAAAYRVHSFEWSSGVAAAMTAIFALENNIAPYELVDNIPSSEPQLDALQLMIQQSGNPIMFPNTSIFNNQWNNWR